MFNASRIAALLRAAGLHWRHAAELGNVLGNKQQELKTGGRLEQDTTPDDLALVTPEARKHHLTNVDFRKGDPDYRAPQIAESEQSRTPQPDPTVKTEQAPQETETSYGLLDGAFTRVVAADGAVAVNMAVRGDGRAMFLDPASNSIVGKTLRCEAGGGGNAQNLVRFFIDENGRELVFKLQLNVERIPIVRSLRYAKGRGLVATIRTASVFVSPMDRQEEALVAPVISQDVVEAITTEGSGLVATNVAVDVFGVSDRPATPFAGSGSTIYLCLVSSSWAKGTSMTLQIYEGAPFAESPKLLPSGDLATVLAYNRYGNLPVGAFCSVALHTNGYYYVIAADCSP